MSNRTITLAMTGVSGVQYGFRLLECLLKKDINVYLMISKAAQVVVNMETDMTLPARAGDIEKLLSEKYAANKDQLSVFGEEEWTAPVASGSNNVDAMAPTDFLCP